jgi:hypothetical protein
MKKKRDYTRIGSEGRVQHVGAPKEEEDGGSPSGGGDELEIVDGLVWLQVGNSLGHLMRNFRRIWTYPPLYHPPCAFLIKKKTQQIVKQLE